MLDVKQAVKIAKEHISSLLADEGVINVGLEEIEYVEDTKQWFVTVGFSREWDLPPNPSKVLEALGQRTPVLSRSFKLLRINATDGTVLSVKDREVNGHGF